MEQTNKDKLKFKIARGINALSNESLEYRKEAIIELFRVFEELTEIIEEKATIIITSSFNHTPDSYLMSTFRWSSDKIKQRQYWNNLYEKLSSNNL
jgi:DNA-directed RNA polymerase alpha subunit